MRCNFKIFSVYHRSVDIVCCASDWWSIGVRICGERVDAYENGHDQLNEEIQQK